MRTSSMRERTPKKAGTEVSFRDAIYASMEQAVLDASSGGEYPFSARDLFYAVRPLYVEHTSKRLDPENGYNTFKGILDAYQEEHGKIEGLYYDPRGRLREPHSGHVVDVGTREIEAYSFPRHAFDKILYVEKEGIWPQLEAHNLAERYDMAILTAKATLRRRPGPSSRRPRRATTSSLSCTTRIPTATTSPAPSAKRRAGCRATRWRS